MTVIEAAGGREIGRLSCPTEAESRLSHDGAQMLVEMPSQSAAVVRVSDGREIWRRDRLARAGLSDDGRYVATVQQDDTLVVWELPSGRQVWRQTGIPHQVTVKDDDEIEIENNVERIQFGAHSERSLHHRRDPCGTRPHLDLAR